MDTGKAIEVDLIQLHLDSDNPRHDPIEDEPAIIAKLYTAERVLGLAKSIAANGGTSPLDKMAVIKHPSGRGHYVVVEGNRRLCALKLLRDPAKAPTPGGKRAIEAAKVSAAALPTRLEVVEFKDRASARRWIALRHQGEQDGAGTKPWTAGQKARFDLAGPKVSNPNVQALALLDYAQACGLISAEQRGELSLTTLSRYLGNPIFRNTLGLVDKSSIDINVDQEQFNRTVRRFLHDALPVSEGTPAVNSRSNQAAWKAYAEKLVTDGVAPTTRLAQPISPSAKPAAKSGGGGGSRSSVHPDKRPRVVPGDFRAAIKDRVLKRIFEELRSIDPDQFSFSAGYLLRAYVEQTAVLFAKKHALGHQGDLHVVIGRCAAKLKAGGASDRVCKPLNEMSSDRHNRLSPDGLGAWVHGSVIPTGAELKRRWDAIEAGFKLMLDDLS